MDWLRRIVMPIIKIVSMDVAIRHHWVSGAKVLCNSYRHKGYWYHGKDRERQTHSLMSEIIRENDLVLEIGGHIGYFTIYFAHLAGPGGRVIVFEPGSNNLPYIEKNISQAGSGTLAKVELIRAAAGLQDGEAILYEEDLTGQNNSMVRDFAGLKENMDRAYVETKVRAQKVPVRAIDSLSISPQFIKIDVEGFEWSVLQGAVVTIEKHSPVLMVEVQADREDIFSFFTARDYLMFDDMMQPLRVSGGLQRNVFCFHSEAHLELVERLSKGTEGAPQWLDDSR